MAKILLVHASPRVGGNSSILADAFIEGAREGGNEVRRIDIGNANISGCKACEYCFKHKGECVQKDDFKNFEEDMHWCDTIIYAFPLYYYSYPAQVKAFMDRQFCAIGNPEKFGFKRSGMLVTMEDKDISTADGLLLSFDIAMNYCKQEIVCKLIVNNVYEKGAIDGNPALDEARKIGAGIK